MAKKSKDIQYYEAVGRRKEAVARVRLYIVGKDKSATVKGEKIKQGTIMVNGKAFENYFPIAADRQRLMQPLALTNNSDRFAISVLVNGGGRIGQLEAVIHGVARSLNILNTDEYRPLLKEHGLLTRDPRTRERRMVGTGGKARRQKQSPKR